MYYDDEKIEGKNVYKFSRSHMYSIVSSTKTEKLKTST